jgi:LysM repeat protein
MRIKLISFFTALLISCTLTFIPSDYAAAQQQSEYHTVQPGETLFSIARDFNLTVGDLRRWNDLDSDNLSAGQTLRIAPPRQQNQITHQVQPGETLFAISRRYQVTIAELQQWNNLRDTNLELGRELTIFLPENGDAERTRPPIANVEPPAAEPEERTPIVRVGEMPAGNTFYNVRSGDTLYRIASEHSMTVAELRELNNLDSDMLRVGQRLTVREVRASAPSVAESAESSTPQGRFVQYRVESGESLSSILRKFQMSERELRSLNPGADLSSISSGQRLTVLLPPTRSFSNPYRRGATLEDLGSVRVLRYSESDVASPTTSGELYNPDMLTAAHANMALGNVVYIENPDTGKGVFVRINDRISGEGLKLSHKAFDMLGFRSIDRAQVTIYLDN